jgi:Flp pilus assembly protein TadG
MKRISYGGASFLTPDDVADALLELVTALGITHTNETLNLPAVDDDGNTVIVTVIVGPMSTLISIPEVSQWTVPDTTNVLVALRARIHALTAPKSYSVEETIATTDFDWQDVDFTQ